jgi:hypothetical protein
MMRTRRDFITGGAALLASPFILARAASASCEFVSFTPYAPPGGGGGGSETAPSGGGSFGSCSLRENAIEGLSPDFQQRVATLILAANMEMGGAMNVYSGYRSIAHQKQLFEAEIAKRGSVEAARVFVAPPGRSMHNFGLAVDLAWNGCGGARVMYGQPISNWMSANLDRFGLIRPLSNEGWHVEPAGGRAVRDQMVAAARGNAHLPLPEASDAGIRDYGSFNPDSSSCQEILRDLPLGGLMPWGSATSMSED